MSRMSRLSCRAQVGDPGRTIVAVAVDCEADLIVMGTHGRSALARMLMGSVAQYVMRHAGCTVLVVKPHSRSVDRVTATDDGSDTANRLTPSI